MIYYVTRCILCYIMLYVVYDVYMYAYIYIYTHIYIYIYIYTHIHTYYVIEERTDYQMAAGALGLGCTAANDQPSSPPPPRKRDGLLGPPYLGAPSLQADMSLLNLIHKTTTVCYQVPRKRDGHRAARNARRATLASPNGIK